MFPTYLLYGMSSDEFWHGRPRLTVAYREANRLKREKEAFDEWKQGAYVLRAVQACLFEEVQYPEMPIFIQNDEELRQEIEKREMQSNIAKMEAYMVSINAKFKKDE